MAVLLTAQQLNDVFKPVTELTKTITNSALVQPVKNVAGQLPSQNSMMARGLGGSPVAQALANLNFPLQETKEAVEESSNQAQQVESESSSIISGELDIIKDLLSHIAIDTEGLVNLNAELLSAWVDQATMERIMHEEQMAQSAADRLRQIEESRERAGASGKASDDGLGKAEKVPDKSGGLFSQIGGMFSKIPGFGMVSSLFSGGLGGITKIFGKLFFPFQIVLGVLSFVEGFIKGKEEGGVGEGITQGFEKVIENLIDVPLNMLKDLLAWALGALGFDEASEQVAGFDINISAIVRPIADFFSMIGNMFSNIAVMVDDALNYASDLGSKALDKINPMNWFGGDDEEEVIEKVPTPRVTPKSLEATGNIGAIDDIVKAAPAKATPASAAAELTESEKFFAEERRLSDEQPQEWRDRAEQRAARISPERRARADAAMAGKAELTNEEEEKKRREVIAKWQAKKEALEADISALEEKERTGELSESEKSNLTKMQRKKRTAGKLIATNEEKLAQLTGTDIRGAAAGRIQDAGVAKAGAGGGAAIVNAPVTNVQEGSKSSVVMPQSRDLHGDPSLAQVSAAAAP
jgi:hypothetical protein